jgi:hypothetical protein
LNVEVFFTLADARRKLHLWRRDYNHHRPHFALEGRTRQSSPLDAAVEKTAVKPPWKTLRVSHFPHRTATAGILGKNNNPSTLLLEVLT